MTFSEIKEAYGQKNMEEIFEMYQSANVNEKENYSENSLLHLAAMHADSRAVEFLLSKGIDPNIENKWGKRPLHLLAEEVRFYDKTSEEIKKCTILLLDAKASTMRKDMDGKTAVIEAAIQGCYKMIEAMLEKGAKLSLTDKEGNTALHLACENISRACTPEAEERYLNTVKVLLEGGLEVETKNNYGQTALDFCIENGNKKLAAILTGNSSEEGNESLEMKTGGMNLFQAIAMRDYESVTANLELGADKNMPSDESGDFHGMSPLEAACYMLDIETVKILLEHDADVNYKNSDGNTAINRWFMYLGDFNFNFEKLEEEAPQKIFDLLLQHGLDIDATIDQEGNTAVIKAAKMMDRCRNYNGSTVASLIMKKLLQNNCSINLSNLEGQTALMFLCMSSSEQSDNFRIEVLEMEADVAAIDKYGNTPLIYAAKNSNNLVAKEVSELLFDFGDPKLEHVNNEKKSAIEIATENDNEELVKYLLMKG